jgi:hypothetical protein
MTDFERRLRDELEPILDSPDPREKLSAYHDMPYALFRYDPDQEYPLRREVTLLQTRLAQRGKRVTRISLAECLHEAMSSLRPMEDWYEAERSSTVEETVQTITNILEEYAPLVDLVAKRMPADPDTERSAAGRKAESDRFRGHARAPIKRGMIANSLSYRPAARPAPPSQCQPSDRCPTSRRRLRVSVAHFG